MQPVNILQQRLSDIQRNVLKTMPRKVGAALVKHYNQRFRDESWEGGKWKDRSRNPRYTNRGKGKGRGILVKTGDLKRSVKASTSGMEITISSDKEYAQIHNEGGPVQTTQKVKAHKRKSQKGKTYTVKAHNRKMNFTMPKRQFMDTPDHAPAPESIEIIISTMEKEIEKHFARL